MSTRFIRALYGVSPLLMVALVTMACPQRVAAQDYDPPGRVARLSYLSGSVSFEPAGESDWGAAVMNRPITTGDRLWADDGSRAEMQLGSATVRLGARTGMSFFNLDDQTTQIELSEGTLNISVLRLDRDEYFEVDTPNQAFSILRPGQYRVQVSEDGSFSQVTVRAGNGEVTGGGRTYSVGAGLTGDFTGTDSLRADIYRAGGNDEFDNWSQDRDRRYDSSSSARYVSRDVVGYQDLDDYGSWRSDPNYGSVWMPRVASSWAPYRDGHWAWISPWGWTWVDDAPWGYAPFHYGRWVNVGNNWGWVPGPIAVRPVYAPALVVFIGGAHFGLSVSIGSAGNGGNVGWFPLGPKEVYVPAYQTSRAYVDRVNISNTTVNNTTITNVYNNTNITNVTYANRNARGGVTAVSQATFTSARPVSRAVVVVNQQEIASAPVNRRAEVAPTRNSVFGSSDLASKRVPQPPAAVANRSVVAKTPPPPAPVSFERQQQKLSAQPGQPLARNEVDGLRPANGLGEQTRVRQAPPGKPATADSNQPARQPVSVQPTNSPATGVGPTSPANAPPGRGNRPDGANQGRKTDNARPATSPAADVAPAPPANAPPGRGNRPNGANRGGQTGNAQPATPPAADVAPAPPANAPPGRGNRRNGANQGSQTDDARPATPPAADMAPAPPANAPPGRGNRPNGTNRGGQTDNAQPAAPRAEDVAPTRPADSAPTGRGNQPRAADRSGQAAGSVGQQENKPPTAQPSQQANEKKARDKKDQTNQPSQH